MVSFPLPSIAMAKMSRTTAAASGSMIHHFFILRGFLVPIGRLSQRFSGVAPQTVGASDLAADVTGVHFIHDIAEGCQLIFSVVAIHTVVDGDKTDAVVWEIAIRVVAHLQIVTAQTGHIFLCQVGTKKFLRIYKPFIGGQPPVNGLRSLCSFAVLCVTFLIWYPEAFFSGCSGSFSSAWSP